MKCQKCSSDRVFYINGKTSDLCYCEYKNFEKDGYVPCDIGLDGGDYIDMNFCLECGQIQGNWPIQEPDLSKDDGWQEV